MAPNKTVVDVASTSDGRLKEVFTVKYNDQNCKVYATNVLNVLGFVASNDAEGGGRLERRVTVHVTESELEIAEEILGIFASNVKKQPRTSAFIITLKQKTRAWQDGTRNAVKALNGVHSAAFQAVRTNDNRSSYANAPLTLNVVGDVDPKDVLNILNNFGRAVRDS